MAGTGQAAQKISSRRWHHPLTAATARFEYPAERPGPEVRGTIVRRTGPLRNRRPRPDRKRWTQERRCAKPGAESPPERLAFASRNLFAPYWLFRFLAKMTILKPSHQANCENTESLTLSVRCGPDPRCDRKQPFEHSGSRQTNKRFPCGRQSRKRPSPRLSRPQWCLCWPAGQVSTQR